MKLEIFRIPRILHSKLTIFHFQAKVEKQALELGERMSNKLFDIIAEAKFRFVATVATGGRVKFVPAV